MKKFYHNKERVFKGSISLLCRNALFRSRGDQHVYKGAGGRSDPSQSYEAARVARATSQPQDGTRSCKFCVKLQLQFKSNQPLKAEEYEGIQELVQNEPALIEEMSLKRSNTYKDPAVAKKPNYQIWNLINQNPTKQVDKFIRPNILKMDTNACKAIMSRIEEDK